ncbi:hypothetical protein D3C84_1006050 [compost metagenome]
MFQIGRVIGLVGIDEHQVELAWLIQLAKGFQCGSQTQIDSPGYTGLLPIAARGGVVVAGNVTADQQTVIRQGRRHAQGAVACKRADFQNASGAGEFYQQGEKLSLLRRHLPAGHGQRLGFVTQALE